MIPVKNSSNVLGYIYEPKTQVLSVRFKGKDNPVYDYRHVTSQMHKEFVAASSKGLWISDKLVGNKAHPVKKRAK